MPPTPQPPPTPTFTPDKRPIQMCETGPQQWTAAEVTSLLGERLLTRAPFIKSDTRGPRYMIHHPASWLDSSQGPTHNMAQYWTLPKDVRDAYAKCVVDTYGTTAPKHKYTLGISCHLLMAHPFSRTAAVPMGVPGSAYYHDYGSFQDRDAMLEGVIRPWHRLFGAGSLPGPGLYEWGMEGGGGDGWYTAQTLGGGLLAGVLTQKIRPIVEAVPVLPNGSVDVDRCARMACWCTREYADGNLAGQSVTACPEVHLVLVGPPGYTVATVDQVLAWMARGFIVGGDWQHDVVIAEARAKAGLP